MTPERDVYAPQLRPGDWVERYGLVQKILIVEEDDGDIRIFTNREGWLRLRRIQRVGIWYSDPRVQPAEPHCPF